MRDPLTWSVPVGQLFGIRVRISLLFLIFAVFELLRGLSEAGWWGLRFTLIWEAILFGSVLLHEFGHCFAARVVGGSAEEILLWPLGGLAFVNAPNTPRAQFITTVWGPLVNVGICLATGSVILASGLGPPINPLHPLTLTKLPGSTMEPLAAPLWLYWLGVAFGLNLIMVLFNVLIPAFPLDGGRMFRCLLWTRIGFGKATLIAVQVAKVCGIVLGIIGLLLLVRGEAGALSGALLFGVAVFVYYSAETERRMLEAGMLFDDSLFGYDFSEGYSSLAKTAPKARRPSLWQRWWRRRERIRQQRRQAQLEEQDRQVDEILAKLHREGMASLTEQERRFLTRVSAEYRSRNRAND
jgi:Zn-dependent protease